MEYLRTFLRIAAVAALLALPGCIVIKTDRAEVVLLKIEKSEPAEKPAEK